MDFTLSEQMISLLYSLLCGVILGAVYDIFRTVRVVAGGRKRIIFVCDLFFMLIFTFVSFFYSMSVTRGNTRYFIVMGEIVGFLVFRLTVGRISVRFFEYLFVSIKKIIKIVIEKFVKNAKKLLQDKYRVLYNMNEKRKVNHNNKRNERKVRKFNKRGLKHNDTKTG